MRIPNGKRRQRRGDRFKSVSAARENKPLTLRGDPLAAPRATASRSCLSRTLRRCQRCQVGPRPVPDRLGRHRAGALYRAGARLARGYIHLIHLHGLRPSHRAPAGDGNLGRATPTPEPEGREGGDGLGEGGLGEVEGGGGGDDAGGD